MTGTRGNWRVGLRGRPAELGQARGAVLLCLLIKLCVHGMIAMTLARIVVQ